MPQFVCYVDCTGYFARLNKLYFHISLSGLVCTRPTRLDYLLSVIYKGIETKPLILIASAHPLIQILINLIRNKIITCFEISFYNHFVLLLITTANHKVIFRTDKPKELFKPVYKEGV